MRLLLRARYDSIAKVGRLASPLLVIHSPEDDLVPFALGRRLFEAAREPKRFLATGGRHEDRGFLCQDRWKEDVRAFKEAGYICFLTVGGKENRAWPIRKGATAWEAAGSIHSDIQKGFIRAEVISYEDFIQAGGETEAKRAGKLRLETKNYVVRDFDLMNFRFNK